MTIKPGSRVREKLAHPVIDIDGHTTESLGALEPYFRAEGVDPASASFRRVLPGLFGPFASWYELAPAERMRRRVSRPPWWGAPARNTYDLATALCPKLMHERMDEFGIDVSVVYPSLGLVFMHLDDERERRGTCRALNKYNAEVFAPLADRLLPVAAIPMYTPQQALEDLEYAVESLGYRAVLFQGYVQRDVAALADRDPEARQYAMWIDMYGLDSAYDYDPLWRRCVQLGVSPAFHSGSIGWGTRNSISNYMYNHLGHLAEGNHCLAKALVMGGVTRRFPELRFAFLEGGAHWAVALFSDLIGHWEKRNRDRMVNELNPATIDHAQLAELLARYASKPIANPSARAAARPTEPPEHLDEWAACAIEKGSDFVELFADKFFFGCEADDPLTAHAFNAKLNPYGARLKAMFGSDLAHWDVPDMAEVLGEAWEMVEHDFITEADFRDFMFTNPVEFYTATNPHFFDGTVVEPAIKECLGA